MAGGERIGADSLRDHWGDKPVRRAYRITAFGASASGESFEIWKVCCFSTTCCYFYSPGRVVQYLLNGMITDGGVCQRHVVMWRLHLVSNLSH